jgi:hypothetical protein
MKGWAPEDATLCLVALTVRHVLPPWYDDARLPGETPWRTRPTL